MLSRNYVFRLPDSGIFCSANRYFPTQESDTYEDGLTLVFTHCASAHKEQWEPTIEKIFSLSVETPNSICIREAWSLDCPNHGNSAELNEETLKAGDYFTMKGYGEALRYFLESELVAGHTIVAIGHSASTAAWTLGCSFYSSVSFRAVIFIESTLDSIKSMSLDDSSINQYLLKLQGTLLRKDAWDDISSLSQWLRKQYPWKLWDQRVLDIYLKHGFKTVVRGEKQVIMPKISKMQEVGAYLYQDHIVALEQLSKLCSKFPVHSVFVQRSELISKRARAVLCDKSEGRNMASVMILPKVGHWCVQEKPELVAEAIFGILNAPVAESRL